ncbi:MAG: helix-turn-helix domain-containing protein [Saprospiraceae bacterium]
MKAPADIRSLYMPVQPTVRTKTEGVTYTEWPPCKPLQPFIYCYWELKTLQPLANPFTYRVVTDGCMDIFFERSRPQESYVMGFCKKYTEFLLDPSFHYLGVRFLPTMFPQFFNINAKELSNRFEHLASVTPETAGFVATHFSAGLDMQQVKDFFDDYFLKLLAAVEWNTDNRLYEAIQIILKNQGMVNVEKDLDTGISPRQLRRLFEFYIGDTAKTFSKVVRFQHILRAKPSTQSLRENKIFFDAGYYDQAHFIKEFKALYGVTPARAFGR